MNSESVMVLGCGVNGLEKVSKYYIIGNGRGLRKPMTLEGDFGR